MKLVRSGLLVGKVLTIGPDPGTRPRLLVSKFLLALAIWDTILDHEDCDSHETKGCITAEDNIACREWDLGCGGVGIVPLCSNDRIERRVP